MKIKGITISFPSFVVDSHGYAVTDPSCQREPCTVIPINNALAWFLSSL